KTSCEDLCGGRRAIGVPTVTANEMTRESQKKEEREQLALAMDLLGLEYQISNEHEPPDIVAKVNNITIGIEVTKKYQEVEGGISAKQEKLLNNITDKAIQLFQQKGGPSLCFAIGYDGNRCIKNTKIFIEQLADYLLKYCRKEEFKQGKQLPHLIPLKFDEYDELLIINNIAVDISKMNCPSGFSVSSFNTQVLNAAAIRQIILEKSTDIKRYKCNLDEKWLLIILPAMSMVADFSLPSKMSVDDAHDFDKIYLLDVYRNKILLVD
ncbi:hypothetical protein MNBD_GAMMA03-43, partial [hydrothermal vent metagenome]